MNKFLFVSVGVLSLKLCTNSVTHLVSIYSDLSTKQFCCRVLQSTKSASQWNVS